MTSSDLKEEPFSPTSPSDLTERLGLGVWPIWVPFPPLLDKTPWPAGLGHIPPLVGEKGG